MTNNRYADSTIKGFLFQFEKTLNELLFAENDEDIITVEGIEDIDVDVSGMMNYIQCKYHETQDNYCNSIIEKPIIQMLNHWCSANQDASINYKLYCHFPNEENRKESLSEEIIKGFLNKNTPDKLEKLKDGIRKHIHKFGDNSIIEFISRFTIEFSSSLAQLKDSNIDRLRQLNFNEDIITEVVHPNALFIIHELAIKNNINDRKISVKEFLQKLKSLDKVLLWKYSKFLNNYRQILTRKRKYLHDNLNINLRRRCFVFDVDSFKDFENTIIIFIKEYLDKFQYKNSKLHISNENIPMFIIANNFESFKTVYKGLRNKNINANIGFTFDLEDWSENEFFKDAVINLKQGAIDFRIRLLYIDENIIENRQSVLSAHTPDDLFIVNTEIFKTLNLAGCNKEIIDVKNINELKYVLNMVKDYE